MLAARMINEFVYCPRLFWLEQVAGEFADNEYTLDGHRVHRNVDKPGGGITPPPCEDENNDALEAWEARSLWLSDETIGVSAKLDLVEEDRDGTVYPVDTKRGRSNDGKIWAADRVQLTLQAMLLRAAGYQVNQIAVWYHTERRRVYEPLTDTLIHEAEQAVIDASRVAGQQRAPAPLVDSKKCFGCSLNTICLPDETNFLSREHDDGVANDETEVFVRRVIPPRVDARPVYIQSYKAQVRLSQNSLKVEEWEEGEPKHHEVGLEQVSHVNLMGNVRITTPAIISLMDRGIPVSWFGGGGWFYGSTRIATDTRIDIRVEQFRAADDERALTTARVLIGDKIANGRTLLRRNLRQRTEEQVLELRSMKRLRDEALRASSAEALLGYEGLAARSFWKVFDEMVRGLDERFAMNGRNRRPPEDPVNALLSYGYGVLTRDCVQAAASVGLDPHLGMYHTTHHGRPSMALDLMEPFRPLIIDSVVWSILSRGEVGAKDFVRTGQAVRMKANAKKALLKAYERRMDEMVTHPSFGYRITYRQLLTVHARLIGRFFIGEIPEPPSFRTR